MRFRNDYYKHIGSNVVNHTTPVPTGILKHTNPMPNTTLVTAHDIKNIPGESTSDMYWGTSDKLHTDIRVSPTSRDQVILRSYVPGVRNLVRAYAMIATDRDMPGSLSSKWSQIISKSWTDDPHTFDLIKPPDNIITNTKSILRRSRILNASISCFMNVHGAIEINNSAVQAHLSSMSTRHHSILIVKELRCAALLDLSMNQMKAGEERHYVVDPTAVIMNERTIAQGPVIENFEQLLQSIIPMSTNLPNLAKSVHDTIMSLPQIEEGEIYEREGAPMTVDIPNVISMDDDINPYFRFPKGTITGPMRPHMKRRSTYDVADVIPHREQPTVHPEHILAQYPYMASQAVSVLTAIKVAVMNEFNNAVIRATEDTPIREALLLTGILDIDRAARCAWQRTMEIVENYPNSRDDIITWARCNMDYPDDMGIANAIEHPYQVKIENKLYWAYRMVMSNTLIIMFRLDEIEMAKTDVHKLWMRWLQNALNKLSYVNDEIWKWRYVREILVDPIWTGISWSSLNSLFRCVKGSIESFSFRVSNIRHAFEFEPTYGFRQMKHAILGVEEPYDEIENRPHCSFRARSKR